MLTLVDLAGRSRSLPYCAPLLVALGMIDCLSDISRAADLLQALEMTSTRALEDLLIEAIYSDLLVGKINQRKQVLGVDSVVGRDVTLASPTAGIGAARTIDSMMVALSAWYAKVDETLANLDQHIGELRMQEYARFTIFYGQKDGTDADRRAREAKYAEQKTANINKTLGDIAKSANAKDNKESNGGRGEWATNNNNNSGGGHLAQLQNDELMEVDSSTDKAKRR